MSMKLYWLISTILTVVIASTMYAMYGFTSGFVIMIMFLIIDFGFYLHVREREQS